jgi:hypothetical protein
MLRAVKAFTNVIEFYGKLICSKVFETHRITKYPRLMPAEPDQKGLSLSYFPSIDPELELATTFRGRIIVR